MVLKSNSVSLTIVGICEESSTLLAIGRKISLSLTSTSIAYGHQSHPINLY